MFPDKKENDTPQEKIDINETRDYLMLAAELFEEGKMGQREFDVFYHGLDPDKRQAFARHEKLDELPHSILDVLMKDQDVQNELKANPAFFVNKKFFSVGDWVRIHGLNSREEIVTKGRGVIAHLLGKAEKRIADNKEGLLRKEEIEALKNIASHIPDLEIIKTLMPFVRIYPQIGNALLENPILTGSAKEIDPKKQEEAAQEIIGRMLNLAEQALRNKERPGINKYRLASLVAEVFRTVSAHKNGLRPFRENIMDMAQRFPEMTEEFISSALDRETILKVFSIRWIRSVIKDSRWERTLKKLYRARFNLELPDPIRKELEKHPDIPRFLYPR